jgi:hypothetical protein
MAATQGVPMLDTSKASFFYEPYPICYLPDVLPAGDYAELVRTYPSIDKFINHDHKYSLAEIHNGQVYRDFIASTPAWRRFHGYIKSPEFIQNVLDFLNSRNIDLGLGRWRQVSSKRRGHQSMLGRLTRTTELSARFEFSMMRPDGGHIRPHTDGPTKIITLVISMIPEGGWNREWGGGTQVCLPKDRTRLYNQNNRYMDFDEVETIRTFEFQPNHCVLFIKTYNSWHQVAPINGVAGGPLRKNITINIERMV